MVLLEPKFTGGNYEAFLNTYKKLIGTSVNNLLDGRLAIVVARNVMDSNNVYRDIVGDLKEVFLENSIGLYNELVLVDPL